MKNLFKKTNMDGQDKLTKVFCQYIQNNTEQTSVISDEQTGRGIENEFCIS